MSSQEQQEFSSLKRIVHGLQNATDVPFIENLKRRVLTAGLRAGPALAPTTIIQTVRNADDSGSEVVAKEPDAKVALYDAKGTLIGYVGVYEES